MLNERIEWKVKLAYWKRAANYVTANDEFSHSKKAPVDMGNAMRDQ